MTRVINNKMGLNSNTAVFGSFTLYSAGVVFVPVTPGPSGCYSLLLGPGLIHKLFNSLYL
jgi:hypothetical protein